MKDLQFDTYVNFFYIQELRRTTMEREGEK